MSNDRRSSYSFTLRAAPSDTNEIELIDYLKSLGRAVASRKIEDALMKTLLSLAKQHSGKYTKHELRLSCLNSCDALSSHSTYLREAFNILDPLRPVSYPVSLSPQVQAGISCKSENGTSNRSVAVMSSQNDSERLIETDEESVVKSINSADLALLDSGFDL